MSKQEHPYAQVLRWIADGESIQADSNYDGHFLNVTCTKTLLEGIAEGRASDPDRFRLKPRTITINGHEVPEPMRVAPKWIAGYYMPDLIDSTYVATSYWGDDKYDEERLARGLCHLTREAAEAHARALLSFATTEQP